MVHGQLHNYIHMKALYNIISPRGSPLSLPFIQWLFPIWPVNSPLLAPRGVSLLGQPIRTKRSNAWLCDEAMYFSLFNYFTTRVVSLFRHNSSITFGIIYSCVFKSIKFTCTHFHDYRQAWNLYVILFVFLIYHNLKV